ncbi:MAG: T9SS type A sorting domain-containing protein, partial [Chitinophagaceae bacterium]
DYNLTTAGQRATTITSGGTCTSQFDFGFSKPNVTVRGTLRNDANGLTDGVVNGTASGAPDGIVVYAYLVDVSGKVALKSTVNSSTGVYTFPLAEINTSYTLLLSTINVALGNTPPSSWSGPTAWTIVGDAFGTNNAAGTGVETGIPNASIAVRSGLVNVTNVDFGIERLPNSDNHIRSVNQPKVNQYITLNGQGLNPPILSGTDPEDCTVGCDLTGRRVIIDTVPNNSELYYNNALVSNGQVITNFNADLFQVKMTAATLGDISIAFRYSFVDAAQIKDPTPASYTLMWLVPLPAVGLTASESLNEKDNIALIKWSTLSEQNTHYFLVERSVDNVNFQTVSNKIQAAGSSESRRDYDMNDNVKTLVQNDVIYYRIKLVDADGKITYSNVVAVRISRKPGVTIWPNPFQSAITISITNEKESTIEINIIDVNGRVLRSSSQKVPKGISLVNMNNLDQLPGGVYLVEITDKIAGTTFQKLIKNK